MALITGTTGTDRLVGTNGDDVLEAFGSDTTYDGREVLIGRLGADTYDLSYTAASTVLDYVIRDDNSDGAVDVLAGVGPVYHSASLGYTSWATVERVGDSLVIHLPSKPYRFRDPAKPDYDIRIIDHFTTGTVEVMMGFDATYNLWVSGDGTEVADMMGGGRASDVLRGLGGGDYICGNGGHDTIDAGTGDDTAFGGNGADVMDMGDGYDMAWGGGGRDRIDLGAGGGRAYGDAGNDVLIGGDGFDWLFGGDGRDALRGGDGQDTLEGGAGDDVLAGGRDGDTYRFWTGPVGGEGFGHDVVREAGDAPGYLNQDILELRDVYGPSAGSSQEAFDRMEIVRSGDDMVIEIDGGASSVTVEGQFGGRRQIDLVVLDGSYWDGIHFFILDGAVDAIGDDRGHPGGYRAEANELIFGTDGDDQIFGCSGANLIWTGDGADVLVYKENDPQNLGGYGGGLSHDIVMDFDVTQDRLDFSEMGISRSDIYVEADAQGNAIVRWTTIDWEISDIWIELRGVGVDEVANDLFVF